jgi:hypothetical protein
MKKIIQKVTSYELRVTGYELRTVILTLLLSYGLTVLNAQIEEKMHPKIEEMVVTKFKNEPVEKYYRYGIKNKEQFENLQLGRAIREYVINDTDTSLIPQGWRVPVMYEGKALFLAQVSAREASFGSPSMGERIHHYERKDLMGVLKVRGLPWEYFYIRRENKDVFIQVFDYATRQYFKNEHNLSEIINLRNRVLELRAANTKESRQELDEIYGTNHVNENDIFDTHFPQKHELKTTPEITEMLTTELYWSFINDSDQNLSDFGITNRVQLENLQLGKPVPEYRIDIDNENLIFTGTWHVPVISDGEPLFTARVNEEGEEKQYGYTGGGGSGGAKIFHNYEHKDLVIGYISGDPSGMSYLIIRKDQKDIFVEAYNYATREHFKNEYSFSELINLLKK